MWRGISLANKCLLLFGAAVVLIIVAALSVSWLRMSAIVDESQRELSRELVAAWETSASELTGSGPLLRPGVESDVGGARVVLLTPEAAAGHSDGFVQRAWARMIEDPDHLEEHQSRWSGLKREYRYAKAVRPAASVREEPDGVVYLRRESATAGTQMLVNMAYLLSAGLIALGLAVLVFYLITNRLILGPVRALKDTAEMVREGDVGVRSEIRTGDEFEELGETFNQMLEALSSTQEQLRAMNRSLDLRVNELAERNVALYEANKLKGEFLANVSHELRTPLNSIIGFTELLIEAADKEAEAGDDSTRLTKRRRYLENIQTSGRNLLELITGLLELAKLEAGRMELRIEPVNLRELLETLGAMMRPLADRGGVELNIELPDDLPVMETDGKKLQQVVFNLLSNAVKFTEHGTVTLTIERDHCVDGDWVRFSVADTGIGISPEQMARLFQPFTQVHQANSSRKYGGTGLGLALSQQLCRLLGGDISVVSEVGKGSVFTVCLPAAINAAHTADVRLDFTQTIRSPIHHDVDHATTAPSLHTTTTLSA